MFIMSANKEILNLNHFSVVREHQALEGDPIRWRLLAVNHDDSFSKIIAVFAEEGDALEATDDLFKAIASGEETWDVNLFNIDEEYPYSL